METQEKTRSKLPVGWKVWIVVLIVGIFIQLFLLIGYRGNIVDVPEIAEKNMPSSVIFQVSKRIGAEMDQDGNEGELVTEGATGFIWADDPEELLIVTNNHVVEGAETIRVRFSPEKAQGILLPAQMIGQDDTADLAVVSIQKKDIPEDILPLIRPAKLGDAKKVRLGEPAILIGNALGEGQNVSCGVISAVNRRLDNGAFQREVLVSDAATNFGNSGSMLLNRRGEVIGINTSKSTRDNSEGMGYYVPVDTMVSVVKELLHQAGR